MRHLKTLIIVIFLVLNAFANSYCQERPCGSADVFYRFTRMFLDEPQDSILKVQFDKLYELEYRVVANLQKNPLLHLIPITDRINSTKQHGYVLDGLIAYHADTKEYRLQLFFVTTCSNKVLAQPEVSFQMYPSWDAAQVAGEAVSKFNSLVNIETFEDDERDSENYGKGGDLWGGGIMITAEKKMVKGEEAPVTIRVVDCDNVVLSNKLISTNGTAGGVFNPATFKTNSNGTALVKFRLTADKAAVMKLQSEIKNVWGCPDLYTGSEVVTGIGGVPVKIEVDYFQDETKTVKRPTLPGVQIEGGEESEQTEMRHRTVLYHFPSAEDLKQGLLVAAGKNTSSPGSKSIYVTEAGWYLYSKTVTAAKIKVMAGNTPFVQAEEKGEDLVYSAEADLDHPSEVLFFKGDASNPEQFQWNIEYPATNGGLAYGGFSITKGEPGVQWMEKKITDPKSPYKTEYILKLNIDAAEELKNGNKAMHDLFGFDLDQMTRKIDPTNPQTNMAGASGTQTIVVRILSPY